MLNKCRKNFFSLVDSIAIIINILDLRLRIGGLIIVGC